MISLTFLKNTNRGIYLVIKTLFAVPLLYSRRLLFSSLTFIFLLAPFLFITTSSIASEGNLYVLHKGSFLISPEPDPLTYKHQRVGYALIGTVAFVEGEEFRICNYHENRWETYVSVITEGGIRGAVLKDCLLDPKDNKLIVPQAVLEKVNIFSLNNPSSRVEIFSRSDGKFAEVIGEEKEGYRVKFPFKYPAKKDNLCGAGVPENSKQIEGLILKQEIKAEGIKVIDPKSYKKREIVHFRPASGSIKEYVDNFLKALEVKPDIISKKTIEKLNKRFKQFLDALTSCSTNVEADLTLRGEFLGLGGGVTFIYELKPKGRKLLIDLCQTISLDRKQNERFLVVKKLECSEGINIKAKRLYIVNLANLKSYNILESEIKENTDLKLIPSGNEESRQKMVTIRGHDDIVKLYNFISNSLDFRKFITAKEEMFNFTDKKIRSFLYFIVQQIASFDRPI